MKKCCTCKTEKNTSDFFKNKSTKDGLSRACRNCDTIMFKKYYLNNKIKIKSRVLSFANSTYQVNQKNIIKFLLQNPCVDCSNSDVRVLEFDHLDPEQKEANISALMRNTKWENILLEIKKCEVVCSNCHRIRTLNRCDSYRTRFTIENGEVLVRDRVLVFKRPTKPMTKKVNECSKKTKSNPLQIIKFSYRPRPTKIKWPSPDELKKMVWSFPRSTLAKKLGVSDKAIAKHCNKLGIEQPPRGYWAKLNFEK